MAWNVVQSASGTASGVSSVSATFSTANVQAGNKIIVAASFGATGGGAISTVQDGGGRSWTQIGNEVGSTSSTVLYALDVPAADVGTKPTITATWTTAAGLSIVIQEVSGLLPGNTTAMVDGSAALLTGSTASTGNPAYTSHAANEYLVSAYGDFGTGFTVTTAGGWTGDAHNVNGSTNSNCLIQYKNSTNGAETDGFTNADTGGWTIVEVAFKLAAGAPAQLPQRQRFKLRQTLQPPQVAPPAAVMVPAPPQGPYLPPRQRRSRAQWRGITGAAYVAVPAPGQQPGAVPPRRHLARAQWRGSKPFLGYVAVPPPPQQPVPAPRRKLARALWRGGSGVAYVAVPPPLQQPVPAPRRKLARAVVEFTPVTTTNSVVPPPAGQVQPWPTVPVPRRRPVRASSRGGAGQAYAFVPAPRQQPGPARRRKLARAYVQFNPVRTTNGGAVVVAGKQVTADYDGKTWWKKKWILRL